MLLRRGCDWCDWDTSCCSMLGGEWVKMVNFLTLWSVVSFWSNSICRIADFFSNFWQMLTRNDRLQCTIHLCLVLSPKQGSFPRVFLLHRVGKRTCRTTIWIVFVLKGTWFCLSTILGERRGGGIAVPSLFLCLRKSLLWSGRFGWVTLISYVEVLYKFMMEAKFDSA